MKKSGYRPGGHVGKRVILGLLSSVAVLIAGCVGCTSLVLNETLPENLITVVSAALLFSGSLIGTVIASAGEGDYRIAVVAFATILYLVLLVGNIVVFDGGLERFGVCSLAVVSGVLVGLGLKFLPIRKSRVQRYKHRFR